MDKIQILLRCLAYQIMSRDHPEENHVGTVLETKTAPALLTLPKFVWEDLENIPHVKGSKNIEGFEVLITSILLLCLEYRVKNNLSWNELLRQMIDLFELEY